MDHAESLYRAKTALFYDRPLSLVERALALAAIDEKLERMAEAHGKGPAEPGPDHPSQP